MEQKTLETSMNPGVVIQEVMGNLQVKGWERPEIQMRAEPDCLNCIQDGDTVTINCSSDLAIRLPGNAAIQLEQANGDARFKLLEDVLAINRINGNLVLRSVGKTTVNQVNGNLTCRQSTADLQVDQVNGNVVVREANGSCLFGQIHGNLDLISVDGSVNADVDGNAKLKLYQMLGDTYKISADGNIFLDLVSNANVKLNLSSDSNQIRIRLPGNAQTIREESYELVLGEGTASMELSASGGVSVSGLEDQEETPGSYDDEGEPFMGLPDDFGDRIANQVEAQIEAQMDLITRQMNEQLSRMTEAFNRYGMTDDEAEEMMNETRRKSAEAAARAEEKMRQAQEKLERKMESYSQRRHTRAPGRRSGTGGSREWRFNWSPPPKPRPAPAPPEVSEEERLMILKMLEEKKISMDEAAKLLSALDGALEGEEV